MKKLMLFIAASLVSSAYAFTYAEQPYIVSKERFFKSPQMTSLRLENKILSFKEADPNETSVSVNGYNLKVHAGEKISLRADFKINIKNNANVIQAYTATTRITVCDTEYKLFQRTYEIKPYQQAHEEIDVFPEFLSATRVGMCYIKANIELRATINGEDFFDQSLAQNTLEISA